jgi:hypothetical protein
MSEMSEGSENRLRGPGSPEDPGDLSNNSLDTFICKANIYLEPSCGEKQQKKSLTKKLV